ncbi:MAG: hypothetical protein AseanaTS_11200 [Candidatus Pelagadaptatus aseana]|uniref:hypothetical protein n=1 Tax=Candidatus Pelagadaptatus aseana TaxID=3120508 RepID=UPI0039B3622A
MKLFIKLLLLMVVLAVSGLFVMKRPDGQPWLDPEHFVPDTTAVERFVGHVKNWFAGFLQEDAGPEPFGQTKVYRWQDKEGYWQLSDTPPADLEAEITYIDPDRNMIQGLRSQPAPQPEAQDVSEQSSGVPLPLTISPSKVQKLMDDAKQVQETLNQRTQDMDAMIGGREPEDR